MTPRTEAARPVVAPLITGHFREGPAYSTWRARGTNDHLLILTRGGRARFGHGGAQDALTAEPGDIVLLLPGTPHDYGTARGADHWELLWTHFLPRPHWLDWLGWPEAAPGLRHLSLRGHATARERVEARLHDMHRLATGALSRRELFALNALEEALLWCDTVNPRSTEARLDPRVARALEYLLGHLGESVALPDLARVAGLSVSRLGHLFRAQVGLTPQQFVEKERIARAQQLLALTPRGVAAVAAEVGFDNPFYFTLRFKRQTGLSPRDWRRSRQGGEPAVTDPPPAGDSA
jgi:AraC family transcriptional regulator of arabinose operon